MVFNGYILDNTVNMEAIVIASAGIRFSECVFEAVIETVDFIACLSK